MYKNNFDCSSSGINIEVSACYDTIGSQTIFDGEYTVVRRKGRERGLLIRSIEFDFEPTKAVDVGVFKNPKHFGPFDKDVLCEILNDCSNYSYDTQSFTYKELKDELREIDILQLPYLLEHYGDYFKMKPEYILYRSCGYGQGDIAYVLCHADTMKNYYHLIDRELWDCPIYASVTIAGHEYRYDELMDNQYEWAREGFLSKVVEQYTSDPAVRESLAKKLNNLLPEELDYV